MFIINMASYLYKTCVKTGVDADGKSLLKHFIFPPFATTNKKTEVSKEDYELLMQHPNFKFRVDNDLVRVDEKNTLVKPKPKGSKPSNSDTDEAPSEK